MHENETGTVIVDCAVHLHQDLGPGLLETVYEVTLARKLKKRADLIVDGKVIAELRSVEKIHPAHKKQLLTYLRLTGMKLGYLLNSGEALTKDGITRTVHGEL